MTFPAATSKDAKLAGGTAFSTAPNAMLTAMNGTSCSDITFKFRKSECATGTTAKRLSELDGTTAGC